MTWHPALLGYALAVIIAVVCLIRPRLSVMLWSITMPVILTAGVIARCADLGPDSVSVNLRVPGLYGIPFLWIVWGILRLPIELRTVPYRVMASVAGLWNLFSIYPFFGTDQSELDIGQAQIFYFRLIFEFISYALCAVGIIVYWRSSVKRS